MMHGPMYIRFATVFYVDCNSSAKFTAFTHIRYAWLYWGADKSLAQPGSKQAQKHVRDARDFNNIETLARQGAKGNLHHSERNISFFPFLVRLRTYQHPCTVTLLLKMWLHIVFVHIQFS